MNINNEKIKKSDIEDYILAIEKVILTIEVEIIIGMIIIFIFIFIYILSWLIIWSS